MEKSRIMTRAHELTKQFINQYPDVDYHVQLGLMITLVHEELTNGILDREVVFPFMYKDEIEFKIVDIQPIANKPEEYHGIFRAGKINHYFTCSGKHPLPVVFGAKNMKVLEACKKAILNIMPNYYDNCRNTISDPAYNYSQLSLGIFVYTVDGKNFEGYYRNRAFVWNSTNKYPSSCGFKTLIKHLNDEKPKQIFYSMKGRGVQIESEIDMVLGLCKSMITENENLENIPTIDEIVIDTKEESTVVEKAEVKTTVMYEEAMNKVKENIRNTYNRNNKKPKLLDKFKRTKKSF